jgi:hypothetical protein
MGNILVVLDGCCSRVIWEVLRLCQGESRDPVCMCFEDRCPFTERQCDAVDGLLYLRPQDNVPVHDRPCLTPMGEVPL